MIRIQTSFVTERIEWIHRITPSSPLIGYSLILIKHWSITQAENFRLQSPFFLKMKSMKSFTSSPGQELLINHVLSKAKVSANRLLIVSSPEQANQLHIPNVIAFCIVEQDGKVKYYRKGR